MRGTRDETRGPDRSGEAADARGSPARLDVRHVTVSYDRRPALRDVTLRIEAGELVAVVGPNGAGKSTLLRAIVGLVPVDAGSITIAGRASVTSRASVAYLQQSASIDPTYPALVRDVVATGRWPHVGAVRRLRDRDRTAIAEALGQVGLEEFATAPAGELSGGQHRRMLIARALCQQAPVLLLDEPYAGIDAATERLIAGVLGDVAKRDVAVVVVQHELSTLAARYSRVVVVNRRLIVEGSPKEVLGGGYGRSAAWRSVRPDRVVPAGDS